MLAPLVSNAAAFELPDLALRGVTTEVAVIDAAPDSRVEVEADGQRYASRADADGRAVLRIVPERVGVLTLSLVSEEGASSPVSLRVVPGVVSVLPPLLAIVVALLMRNVIPAMLLGIWCGATALHSFTPRGAGLGLMDAFAEFVVGALANRDHAAIVLFSMMVGGMIGIITRNGGMAAIVRGLAAGASTAVRAQLAVWSMGLLIFFDDYSNTLVVGNTAKPLTDRLRVSREKLAYIVDSTAAPVVCVALITTWIGYEVGLIDAAIADIPEISESAYTVFLKSIPYSFYPLLAIFFVFAVAWTGRDFGPMYAAERRARTGNAQEAADSDQPAMRGDVLEPKPDVPLSAWNAALPLFVLIVTLVVGLAATGTGDSFTARIGSANAYLAMLWASLFGAMTAAVITLTRRIMNAHETVDAWYGGVRAMLFAMIVLVLAWALSAVTDRLHTADYLVSVLGSSLPPQAVPATVFVLSGVTAFTTGTSWGTMGILMPLVVPLCWAVMQQHGLTSPGDMHILYSAIACNLAGAVWGDHCSPISDTTVLSSMASGCDHIEHVRTQMPYAMVVGTVAVGVGTVPGAFGVSPWLSLLVGVALLWGVLRVIGRTSDSAATAGV
ncbi:MAG: Na+/H+ antiporter NhaC family protein [Pseudomonadota bacterium]